MLASFSFMQGTIDASFYYDVWEQIQGLKGYFYKFAGENAEEAMQRTLLHTITHFNSSGNLSAYVKKLAREIMKDGNRLIYVDFLEQTLAEDDEESSAKVDLGRVSDFSYEVIEALDSRSSRMPDIIKVALQYMDRFLVLCEALINHDTTTLYYPDSFIKECLKIARHCNSFSRMCIDLYARYKEEFEWFLNLDSGNIGVWKETDFLLINQSQSKRVKLLDPVTKKEVEDADIDDWVLKGSLGGDGSKKYILRVDYLDAWEIMCDLIDDTETNAMKFIINGIYIVRTLGGSVSIINPDLFNLYDLVRMEILTNVLQDTRGRVLNVGSRAIYLLCTSMPDSLDQLEHRVIKGIHIDLKYSDITETV